MGRRRAEIVCASLLHSCRAARPFHPFRRAYSSNGQDRQHQNPDELFEEGHATVNTFEKFGKNKCFIHVPGLADLKPPPKNKENRPRKPRIAVLGGGITGLTTAFYLARKLPEARIVVYEADNRWGGWLKSERVRVGATEGTEGLDVLFERGPRLISLSRTGGRLDQLIFADIMETLGLMPVKPTRDLQRYVWLDGRLRSLSRLLDNLTSPTFWSIMGTLKRNRYWYLLIAYVATARGVPAFIKDWAERQKPWLPQLKKDASVGDLMHHLSGSLPLINGPLSALMHGIWGGNVWKLSAISATGWLFDYWQEVTTSMLYRRHQMRLAPKQAFLYPKKEFLFFQRLWADLEKEGRTKDFMKYWEQTPDAMAHVGPHGMQNLAVGLVDMLESASNVELRVGCGVKGLHNEKQAGKIQIVDKTNKAERFDKVISTLPAEKLANIGKNVAPLPLEEFNSVSVMTVNLWYPFADLVPKGVGYLIPASTPFEENPERALGVFFDSAAGIGEPYSRPGVKSVERREYGTKLFVLLGGHLYDRDGVKPPTQEEAIEQAKSLVNRQLGIPKDLHVEASANLAKDCLPQHNVGHYERLTALHDDLINKYSGRLSVVGGSFTKPGVSGALRAGYDIADTVANDDFLATGLESYRAPEVYAGTPTTIVDPGTCDISFLTLLFKAEEKKSARV